MTSTLIGGAFTNRGGAEAAYAALTDVGQPGSADIQVVLFGSNGVNRLLVAVPTARTIPWVTRTLRDHGAALDERPQTERVPDKMGATDPDVSSPEAADAALLAHWTAAAMLLLDRGLLTPNDLLALAMSTEPSTDSPQGGRWLRSREVDAELREVSARLATGLRSRYPDLFDQKGRLRPSALTHRLAERTGGKLVLSGADLRTLEDEADAPIVRSMGAP